MKAEELLQKFSKAKEFFNSIATLFNEADPVPAPAPAPVALIEVKTKDGVTVSVDKLEVGGIATIDGAPAPVGEHTLEDGTVIVIKDNGVIAEVKPANTTPEEPPMQEDMAAKFASYEAKFTAFEASVSKLLSEQTEVIKKQREAIKQLFEINEQILKAPVADPDPSIEDKTKFSATVLFN